MSFLKRLFGKCCCDCNCNCNCNCNCRCTPNGIRKGDMVRYNDEAKKHIASVIPEGNPFKRVTDIEECRDGRFVVVRCGNEKSDSVWLEKCCC